MREMSSVTALHVTFDHCYLTRPELDRCVAAVLAHTPHPSASTLCSKLVPGTFECIFFLKCEFGDLEKSRSNGDDLEIVLCGYGVYHEDELRL